MPHHLLDLVDTRGRRYHNLIGNFPRDRSWRPTLGREGPGGLEPRAPGDCRLAGVRVPTGTTTSARQRPGPENPSLTPVILGVVPSGTTTYGLAPTSHAEIPSEWWRHASDQPQRDRSHAQSSGGGTRTPDTRIMITGVAQDGTNSAVGRCGERYQRVIDFARGLTGLARRSILPGAWPSAMWEVSPGGGGADPPPPLISPGQRRMCSWSPAIPGSRAA